MEKWKNRTKTVFSFFNLSLLQGGNTSNFSATLSEVLQALHFSRNKKLKQMFG
jgi:hypothetical protein